MAGSSTVYDGMCHLGKVRSDFHSYLLSHVVLPKAMVARLEQYFRSFLWGSHPGGGGGVHLLAWDVVCKPR